MLVTKILSNVKDYNKILSFKLGKKIIHYCISLLRLPELCYLKNVFQLLKDQDMNIIKHNVIPVMSEINKEISILHLFIKYSISNVICSNQLLASYVDCGLSKIQIADLLKIKINTENSRIIISLINKYSVNILNSLTFKYSYNTCNTYKSINKCHSDSNKN